MSDAVIVGIDLGTTNSEVACLVDGRPHVVDEGGDRGIVPSVVGLDGQGRIVVGALARNQYAAAPERTVRSIKRRMGSDEPVVLGSQAYSPAEISAFILTALRERAERFLGQPVGRAVITVPAYFTDAQRQATREAGQIAGLEVVRIINEPTAAALAYGALGHEGSRLLVYDLGGGTFDVSVVAVEAGVVEVLASTGDNHLGGDDFDARILERLNGHLAAELGLAAPAADLILQARLLRAAEAAKIELSSAPFARIEEDHVGQTDGRPRHLAFELTRDAFEQDVEDLLERTMGLVTAALADAGVQPRQLDRVLLVGGSTRMPRVAELLRAHVGDEPHGEVDPDLCVALGAAVQAGMEMGLDASAVLVDVTPYTFGVRAVGEVNGEYCPDAFIPLIRRNTKLPARRTDVFFTMHDEQEKAVVEVYQGEDADARNNVRVGQFEFAGLNERRGAQEEGILITYSLDLDGILEVHAVERATGRQIRGMVDNALVTDAGIVETARKRIESAWGAGTGSAEGAHAAVAEDGSEAGADAGLAPALARVLERADKALDAAAEEDREEIVNLMEDLRNAARDGRTADAERARAQLEDILFYVE